jgi:hypothetical protein
MLTLQKAQSNGIKVCVQTYITSKLPIDIGFHVSIASPPNAATADSLQGEKMGLKESIAFFPGQETAGKIPTATISLKDSADTGSSTRSTDSESLQDNSTVATLPITYGRPRSLDALIRPTVEDSEGETAIIACGGATFMAEVRNYTAALSDERAVHKGTGAQGIFLFTETYGW